MTDSPKPIIYSGTTPVQKLFVGDIGVKQLTINTTTYTRQGGYFYLELDTKGVSK